MDERTTVERLLGEVGHRVGARLTLDADGACAMTYRGGGQVVVEAADGTGCVVLHAPVAPASGTGREALYARALKLNLLGVETGGCTLGLDEANAEIVLMLTRSLEGMDALGFEALLANFIDRTARLKALLVEVEADDAPAGRGDRDAFLRGLGVRA